MTKKAIVAAQGGDLTVEILAPVNEALPGLIPLKTDTKVLYVKVMTLTERGEVIGERIVDMYHFGTRKWIQEHMWWSTHNAHRLEIENASPTDVDEYLAGQVKRLAERFNSGATAH